MYHGCVPMNEDGSFTVSSEDGNVCTNVSFVEGLASYQTAYMVCLSAAMNAEVDGFEEYTIGEMYVDGMKVFWAVMADKDGDSGFRLYMTLVDSENGMMRILSHTNLEYTLENLVSSSASFDSYRRSDN